MKCLLLGCLAAACMAVLVPAPRSEEKKEDAEMKKALLSLEDGAMERWRQGDPMGWTEISAPEVIYIDPGLTRPIVGLADYTRYLASLKGKIRYDGSEYIHPKVAVYGDLAVLTYNYRSFVRGPDQKIKDETLWNTTEVYVLAGGRWKIVHTHWSTVKHRLPETLEIPLPVELAQPVYEGVPGELMVLEAAAMERWRKGDPSMAIGHCAPEVTYFDSDTPSRLDGLEALKAEYKKIEGKVHFDVMEFIAPRVLVYGDAAVFTYRFFSTVLQPDGRIATRVPWNCTEVYARIGGQWKIVHSHWSLINGRQ